MIAEKLPKLNKPSVERGIPEGSYFEATFSDGSIAREETSSWSSFSHKETVNYQGRPKLCLVCDYAIKKITVTLAGLVTTMEVPEGCAVYQFMRSERLIAKDIEQDNVIGRGMGIIRHGIVIEERYINKLESRIMGMRI